jgi:hypothetical protein
MRSRVSVVLDGSADTEWLVGGVSILTTAISDVPEAIRSGCKRGRTTNRAGVVSGFESRAGSSIVLARKATPLCWGFRKRKSSGRSQAQKIISGKDLVRARAKTVVCE